MKGYKPILKTPKELVEDLIELYEQKDKEQGIRYMEAEDDLERNLIIGRTTAYMLILHDLNKLKNKV